MVLCKYFQQGSCRFGTKCNNEHFDVKQIIKTDVESAINGKQWPFTCYGPFKDRPCVPNFIDDQSFEEVRWRFFECQQKNMIDQYLQQFNMDMATATNKMKVLLQLTPEVVEMFTQLYDTPMDKSAIAKPNNPFGFAQTNPDPTGGSIFNKPATTPAMGNIFGGGFNSNSAAGNVFGGDTVNTVAAGNIFGGSTNVGGGTNLFQTANNNTQNAFGQALAKPAGNIFASAAAQPNANPFQANQSTPMGAASGGNLFASSVQPPNVFAQAAQQFPQQQMQQQHPPNAFAQTGQMFLQNVQTQAQPAQLQQQPQQTGFFQQPQVMQAAMQPQQQQQQFPPTQAPMQQPLLPSPAPANTNNNLLYSRMEDLSPEDIEAFRADAFLSGQIPCVPPPKELCN